MCYFPPSDPKEIKFNIYIDRAVTKKNNNCKTNKMLYLKNHSISIKSNYNTKYVSSQRILGIIFSLISTTIQNGYYYYFLFKFYQFIYIPRDPPSSYWYYYISIVIHVLSLDILYFIFICFIFLFFQVRTICLQHYFGQVKSCIIQFNFFIFTSFYFTFKYNFSPAITGLFSLFTTVVLSCLLVVQGIVSP